MVRRSVRGYALLLSNISRMRDCTTFASMAPMAFWRSSGRTSALVRVSADEVRRSLKEFNAGDAQDWVEKTTLLRSASGLALAVLGVSGPGMLFSHFMWYSAATLGLRICRAARTRGRTKHS